MIEILKSFLDLLGKRLWLIVLFVLLAVLATIAVTFATPITVDIFSCTQREDQWQLHDVRYTAKSLVETNGKTTVKLCINETYKTLKTNLVEK